MSLTFHVEIARKLKSKLKRAELIELVKTKVESIHDPCKFNLDQACNDGLKQHVESLRVHVETHAANPSNENHCTNGYSRHNGESFENGDNDEPLPKRQAEDVMRNNFKYHCFELNDDLDEAEFMDDGEDGDGGQSASSHHWILPSKAFDGLWESLIFDIDIKTRLMEYIKTALLFSEKGVNSSLIAWNKVILLHGPPGTGKTSLCKALAHKASIHLGEHFLYGQFVEINSHSLFSKWFSESGKLIMKMFEKVHELIEDSQSIVFLLIDEVESLAQCRISAEAGNEPSDSIRAVNALLTQIDRIKRYPNVVILTTSNIAGSIDLAFVDRADLKIYIGAPPAEIIYEIYSSSINELIRVGIISKPDNGDLPNRIKDSEELSENVKKLLLLSKNSHGMSGRTLRKIPFLTHVNFIRSKACTLENFLNGMSQSIDVEKTESESLRNYKINPQYD